MRPLYCESAGLPRGVEDLTLVVYLPADLTRHKGNFPNIQGPGLPLIGVQRIYELLDAGANRR